MPCLFSNLLSRLVPIELWFNFPGCVDFTNPDNAGLGVPLEAIGPIVDTYEPLGLSRTDIWMLAAVVSAAVLQPRETPIDFPFQWIGRKTCEQLNNNNCGTTFLGDPAACTLARGPHREMCHGESGTDTIMEFFRREFNFTGQKVAAIMGAHSIGKMRRRTLGFDSPAGWDLSDFQLDNGFHIELIGLKEDSFASLPNWKQVLVDNSDIADIPDRFQWEADVADTRLAMLNSDIAMVRQISNGKSACTFMGTNRCADAKETIDHMMMYAWNRQVFLEDFREALLHMIENGYRRNLTACTGKTVCRLIVV
jgi:hypothetical protein